MIYGSVLTADWAAVDPMLEMKAVTLDFGGGAGVFNLSFRLPAGAILGIIGPSGCGKTSTVRLLTGIYRPSRGEVCVFGQAPAAFSTADKDRIGYIPQQFILYPYLSVEENLHFMGGMYGLSLAERKKRMDSLLEFVEMNDARTRLGWQLSGGMQRRLMLAGALLHNPDLIFADEPTAGIDPILRARIWQNFRELRDKGRTILVTTQYVGEAAFCDLVGVMLGGRLVAIDTPEGLRRQAMGGDVIRLHVEPERIFQVMELLSSLPQVKKVEGVEGQEDGVCVFVESAGRAFPGLLAALREGLDLTPRSAEPYLPPFDEVFVRIVQNARRTE